MQEMIKTIHQEEDGATTAEYGVVVLAAVGFAGVLALVLSSDEVRGMLMNLIQQALSL